VLASRAQIETVLSAGQAEGSRGIARRTMPLPGFASPGWDIGMAVKENSRNLGDALEGLLGAMAASGELKAIFARHGVTWTRRWPPEQGRRPRPKVQLFARTGIIICASRRQSGVRNRTGSRMMTKGRLKRSMTAMAAIALAITGAPLLAQTGTPAPEPLRPALAPPMRN
jgi:hypothetical protein